MRFSVSFEMPGDVTIRTSCELDVTTLEEAFAKGAEFHALAIAAMRGAGHEAEQIEGR